MYTSRLRLGYPRAALVIAPHPDDEAIGAANLILALHRQGTRVRVAIVTDGAASHPASLLWPPQRLITERRKETRRALHRLDVPVRAVTFIGLADGSLSQEVEPCRRAIRRLIARGRFDLIVGPTLDDDHPDHRAVASAIATCRSPARHLGYRIWPARRARTRAERTLPTGLSVMAKRSLLRCYRTQLGLIRDDPHGFAIATHELSAFAAPRERFTELRR